MGKMASRSVAPHGMAVDDSEQSTYAEVSLDPWDGADPYICRFHSTEDGVSDCVELPGVPFIYLAEMGLRRVNARTRIYGTEMDVCNRYAGIKTLRGWKSDPSEIALYERPDPTKPVLNLVGDYPVVSMGLLSRTFRMCVARRKQLTKLCMCFRAVCSASSWALAGHPSGLWNAVLRAGL